MFSKQRKLRHILETKENEFMITNTYAVYGITSHPGYIFYFTFCCLFWDAADSAVVGLTYVYVCR